MKIVSRYDSEQVLFEIPGESLTGADLRYADLRCADLRCADLHCADLHCADLRGADLLGADLHYADLRYADLRGADLHYADLRYADLRGADLHYADLRGGLRLIGRRPLLTVSPIGNEHRHLMAWITDKGLYIEIGCFFGTDLEFLDKLEKECNDATTKAECLAAIELARVHFKHWGESCT